MILVLKKYLNRRKINESNQTYGADTKVVILFWSHPGEWAQQWVRNSQECLGLSSDCHRLHNLCGLRVGYARVGVRVGICRPWMNPYPRNGFRVTRTVTRHISNWQLIRHPQPWPPLTTSYNPWKRAVAFVLAMPTLKPPKSAAMFSSYSGFKLQVQEEGVHITQWVFGHFVK